MEIRLCGSAVTVCDACDDLTLCTYWTKPTWIFTMCHCDKCLPRHLRLTQQTKVVVKEATNEQSQSR